MTTELKSTKPLSGFVELLPAQQRFMDDCVARMRGVLKNAGFEYLDLPAVERAEVLTDAEDFEDTATEMYLFQKGETKMGLRYDGTVGLARYVAGHLNDLAFPFRATQYSKRYRGERPQKYRYREFYQLDMDIMGVGRLSTNYDAELIAVWEQVYSVIPELVGRYTIRIGSRRFWNAVFDWMGFDDDARRAALVLIDKQKKMPGDEFLAGLATVFRENADLINSVFTIGYSVLLNCDVNIDAAIAELDDFGKLLECSGVKNFQIDVAIVRGLGYYTGLVYEAVSDDYPELGSIGGGGQYENLVGKFSKTKIAGVGLAIGINRVVAMAIDSGRIDWSKYETPADVAVLVIGQQQAAYAINVLNELRGAGVVAVPYLDTDKKFKNQIEFADKIGSRFSVIIGEDEVSSEMLTVKNMTSGDQQKLALADVIKLVK